MFTKIYYLVYTLDLFILPQNEVMLLRAMSINWYDAVNNEIRALPRTDDFYKRMMQQFYEAC